MCPAAIKYYVHAYITHTCTNQHWRNIAEIQETGTKVWSRNETTRVARPRMGRDEEDGDVRVFIGN